MSDLENKNQEAATKKRPYNLREKSYRKLPAIKYLLE